MILWRFVKFIIISRQNVVNTVQLLIKIYAKLVSAEFCCLFTQRWKDSFMQKATGVINGCFLGFGSSSLAKYIVTFAP